MAAAAVMPPILPARLLPIPTAIAAARRNLYTAEGEDACRLAGVCGTHAMVCGTHAMAPSLLENSSLHTQIAQVRSAHRTARCLGFDMILLVGNPSSWQESLPQTAALIRGRCTSVKAFSLFLRTRKQSNIFALKLPLLSILQAIVSSSYSPQTTDATNS